MYNEKVLGIFKESRNAGIIKGADGTGQVGNARCGDIMKIYLKINKAGIITDAKFKTFGCVSAIAATSIMCDMIKDRHIDEALKITNQDVVDALEGLPPQKIHCSVLAAEAVAAAIANYHKRQEARKRRQSAR